MSLRGCHNVNSSLSTSIANRPRSTLRLAGARSQRYWHRPRNFASIATAATPKVLINDLQSQEVVVDFNDAQGTATRYPSFWLRDHCPCQECTHPQTRQRQLDTFAIIDPDQTKAVEAESTPEGLRVVWSDVGLSSTVPESDSSSSHTSLFPWTWLQEHTPFTTTPKFANPRGEAGWQHVPASPSTTSTTSKPWPYPAVEFNDAMKTDAGLSQLLYNIRTYGLSFISSTPASDPSYTEALANRIAFIRQTHYGGFWEVISRVNPTDTAYTNLFLPNHTDNTYFTDPCGLQMFHCLQHTAGEDNNVSYPPPKSKEDVGDDLGGESTFIDGFAAAQKLYQTSPTDYKTLSTTPIISHASGDPEAGTILNTSLSSSGYPVLSHLLNPYSAPSSFSLPKLMSPPNLSQIRWNNADRHSSTIWPSHQAMRKWYEAAHAFNKILSQSPELEIVIKLEPGTVVVFDNWRVLHGRKAFKGVRKLCGAYIGMDDFLGRGRLVDEKIAASASTSASTDGENKK